MSPYKYSQWVEGKIVTEGQTRLFENALGLSGEVGEVSEKIKKMLRDDSKFTPDDFARELGDVLFYLTAIGNYYGIDLENIMEMNIEKLDDRQKRGVIKGSGDNR